MSYNHYTVALFCYILGISVSNDMSEHIAQTKSNIDTFKMNNNNKIETPQSILFYIIINMFVKLSYII